MIVILGSSGYVGTVFRHALKVQGKPFICLRRRECNLYDADELSRRIETARGTSLINCAGYTGKPNVDACELDKMNCLAANAVLPGVIARACERVAIPWGHVSSGCIFTGARSDGRGFTEFDLPNFSFRQNNCSFYSGSKALGEEILQGANQCYIWRLRIPFSNIDSSRNYLSKLMRYEVLLEAKNSLSNLPEFVDAAIDCIERKLPFGVYNLTNPGFVTTSEVTSLIKECEVMHKDFRFFESDEDFMSNCARTPRSNCILDSSKAITAGLRLTPVHDAVRNSLLNWRTETFA